MADKEENIIEGNPVLVKMQGKEIIVGIYRGFICLLLSVIGFFLIGFSNKVDRIEDKVDSCLTSIAEMRTAKEYEKEKINELKGRVDAISQQINRVSPIPSTP